MKTSYIVAIVAVLVLLLALFLYWGDKDTVRFDVTSVSLSTGPAAGTTVITMTGKTSSKSDAASWVGRRVFVRTKSLGDFDTTIASASVTGGVGTISTAGVVMPAGSTYTASSKDHARIILKL